VELARAVFGHLCHQEPSRAWQFGGEAAVLCARCTGVYASAALATLALPFARFEPSRRILWLFGAAMIQMGILGFNPFFEPTWLRTLSGSVFSAGAVYFLWLPARAALWPGGGRPRTFFYAAAGAIVLLQVLVHIDLPAMAYVIETIALFGIAAFAALAALDIAVLTRYLFPARRGA
jgi:uncharacterized membrane protein